MGGLSLERGARESGVDKAAIESKITERNHARAARDWATSDRIRDDLVEMGIALKDGPEGTTWTRIVK